MRQRISRTDRTHAPLAKVARQLDPGGLDCHAFGPLGCDHLGRHVRTKEPRFLEFKDPLLPPSKRALTDNELAMQARFPEHYFVCMTTEDVVAALTK